MTKMTPEDKKEYAKKWRAEHPNYSREYYAKNIERFKEIAKVKYKIRKEKKMRKASEIFY